MSSHFSAPQKVGSMAEGGDVATTPLNRHPGNLQKSLALIHFVFRQFFKLLKSAPTSTTPFAFAIILPNTR
jgi:hypothetical protein